MENYGLCKSVSNVRGYAGIKTKYGVIKDRIYRGAELSRLSEVDGQLLYGEKKIKSIVDFRTDHEVKHQPDIVYPGVNYQQFDVIGEGILSANPDEMLAFEESESFNRMVVLYQAFPIMDSATKAYQQFFATLLASEDGVFFHCTAGKDRTGFGGALLLHVLGADSQQIVDDYMLSNRFRRQLMEDEIAKIMNKPEHPEEAVVRNDIENLFGVRQAFLQAADDSILEHHQSVDAYLKDIIGLSELDLQALRAKFLD